MLELFVSVVEGATFLAIFFLLGVVVLAFTLLIIALLIVSMRLIRFLLPAAVFALIIILVLKLSGVF